MSIGLAVLFLASPVVLCGGLFIKNKKIAAFFCGLVFFICFAVNYLSFFESLYEWIFELPLDDVSPSANPGFFYSLKLTSMIFSDYRPAALVWSLTVTVCLMLYIYKHCYYIAPSAVTAVISGLWLINFADPCLFAGLLIVSFSFRYASERRFVRFAALILLASCFSAVLLLLIPFYIIFITKPTLRHIPVGVAAAGALLLFDLSPVFAFLGINSETPPAGAELFYPLTIIVVCVLGAVCAKITTRRGSYNGTMITVLAVSAIFAAGSIRDERLLVPAVACFFPCVLTLVPEIISVLKSVISLTFRNNRKSAVVAMGAVIVIAAVIYYGVVILRPSWGLSVGTWIGVTI